MNGTPAIYLGRIVEKKGFRAFIYAPNGGKRLVESWEEFEANMATGMWFATAEDALASLSAPPEPEKQKSKPRPSRAKPKPEVAVEESLEEDVDEDENPIPDDAAFEVTGDDDFLPKGK